MRGLAIRRFGFAATLAAVVAFSLGLLPTPETSAEDATISVSSVKTGVGMEGTVTLEALGIGAPGLGAWTIDIVYDPTVVSPVDCTAQEGGICNLAYADDTLRVAGISVFGLEGDILLAEITFACESAGSSELAPTASVLADALPGAPQPIAAVMQNGTVTCNAEAPPPPSPSPEPPPAPVGLPGDANCDSQVNSIDAAFVLQFAAMLIDEVPCPDNADVNQDGVINSIDAALILQISAGLLD